MVIRTPALWTILTYPPTSADWQRLRVERHGNAPFYIRGETAHSLEHLGEARSAHVHDFAEGPSDLDCPTPALRVLDASLYQEKYVYEVEPPLLRITFAFLGGCCVSLVRLKLSGDGFSLDNAPPIPALLHLELSSVRTGYDLASLTNLISNAPALQEIALTSILVTEHLGSVDPAEIIPIPAASLNLPSMRRLFMKDTPAEVSALVRLILSSGSTIGSIIGVQPWIEYEKDDEDEDPVPATELNVNHAAIYQTWRTAALAHGSTEITGEMRLRVPYRACRGQ